MTGRRGGRRASILQPVPAFPFRQPAAGVQTFPMELATGSVTLANQAMRCILFVADQSRTVSNVTVCTSTPGAADDPTLVRFGIYSISGTTATQIGVTPNDTPTTLLASTFSAYTKALSASADLVRGASYFFTALVVTGVAAPVVIAAPSNGGVSALMDTVFGSGFRVQGTIAGQADLPASFTTTSVATGTSSGVWAYLS